MSRVRLLPLLLALASARAEAQVTIGGAPWGLTVEAFANVTAGREDGADDPFARRDVGARLDGAVRLIGLVKTDGGFAFGPRVVVETTPGDSVGFAERSLLVQGSWGRVELGHRQGLPDVLIGYPPNSFTFTGAEYGPATGPGLDPDGRLPTSRLDAGLASQIDALSYLGFAAALYLDQSRKVIYVSPRKRGFLAGLSFAPDVDDRYGPYGRLLQTGLVYEGYTESHIVRVGATYTYAAGRPQVASAPATGDLHSISAGATVTLHERLILAAAASFDGRSGRERPVTGVTPAAAFGYSASVNYNVGAWTVGGYYQAARAEGDIALPGEDRLTAFQLGASYRFDRRLRLYGAAYFYRFADEAGQGPARRPAGAVLLFGARATL